jgi:hypothetical protein
MNLPVNILFYSRIIIPGDPCRNYWRIRPYTLVFLALLHGNFKWAYAYFLGARRR